MLQQMIQDVLALAEASGRPEDLLAKLKERIATVERLDCGEILAITQRGLVRFELAPGLGEVGTTALKVLGDQPMLRFDLIAQMHEAGLTPPQGLNSLLILRLEASGATSAALVLGHARAWSFPGAPLTRIRTMGGVTLRLLLAQSASPTAVPSATADASLATEVTRLRAHVATLEREIAELRDDKAKRRSGKPR
ncbi:MAG: hypothetical protein ABI672_16140 [Vicinamibacteria bacterium]